MDMPYNESPSAGEEVAKLRLQLSHKSLEELVDHGLVTWDRENDAVIKGPRFDRGRIL